MTRKRKYPPGFAPIDFHSAGKALIVFGMILFVLNGIGIVAGWFNLLKLTMAPSLFMIFVGIYLIFVVPREDE